MRYLLFTTLLFFSVQSFAANVGKTAPAFSLKGHDNKTYSLKDYSGKYVVLEWLNHGCPFVRKHYDSQNMQNLQKEFVAKGVVWLSIISSAEGKQGHVDPAGAKVDIKENGAFASAVLLDPSGKVGRLYGAKTTPQMYIVNPKGTLVYNGAIDSIASADEDDIKNADNYVKENLSLLLSGKEAKYKKTRPYGCSVKY
ncbi:MAG: thioredoxin family protein [Bacteriovoracaceae bacterium]